MTSAELHPDLRKWIEERVPRYPTRRSMLVPALLMAARYHDYASPTVMRALAELLETPLSMVMSAASFYTLIPKRPVGKHVIQVCHNVACWLRASDELIAHLEHRLGVKVGGTTGDGKFTLVTVECLAACGSAPAMMIGERLYENVTPADADRALADLGGAQ